MKSAKTTTVAAKTAANASSKVVGDVDFKIEDNVPLPTTARPVRYFPFDKLKSGQSFLVLKDQRAGLRTSLAAYYKSSGETRTIIMRRQDDESIRVWRK